MRIFVVKDKQSVQIGRFTGNEGRINLSIVFGDYTFSDNFDTPLAASSGLLEFLGEDFHKKVQPDCIYVEAENEDQLTQSAVEYFSSKIGTELDVKNVERGFNVINNAAVPVEKLAQTANEATDLISQRQESAVNAVTNLANISNEGKKRVGDSADACIDALGSCSTQATNAGETVTGAAGGLRDKLSEVGENAKTVVEGAASYLKENLDPVVAYNAAAKAIAAAVVGEQLSQEATKTWIDTVSLMANMKDALSYTAKLGETTNNLNDAVTKLGDVTQTCISGVRTALAAEHDSFVEDANLLTTTIKNYAQSTVNQMQQENETMRNSVNTIAKVEAWTTYVNIALTVIAILFGIATLVKEKKHGGKQ